MPTRLFTHWKFIFDALLFASLYTGGIFAFDARFAYIITIIGASLAGSLTLAYFKRDRDRKEIFYKAAVSSVCGLVVGSTICEYYTVEKLSYIIVIYFLSSLLSLFILRGLVMITDTNANSILNILLSRYSNVNLKQVETTESKETVTTTNIEANK